MTKNLILKIAKEKDIKSFYKKYPTEAAFFKAHPEAKSIKKAQSGAGLQTDANHNGIPDYLEITPTAQMGPNLPMGANQFMQGNNTIGSFASGNLPPQYSGSMFKPTQIPQVNYGIPDQNKFGKPSQDWEIPSVNEISAGLPKSQSYGMDQYVQANNQAVTGQPTTTNTNKGGGQPFNMQGFANVINGTKEAVDQMQEDNRVLTNKHAWAGASNVIRDAEISNAYAQKPKRKWFRPDDRKFIHNANELSNIQGRGTDILATQNGSMIGGNPTEVQNTYAPEHTLFDDLGYVPNNQKLKAYAGGGGFGNWWGQANAGLSGSNDTSFMGNVGKGSSFDSITGAGSNYNAGWKLGSSLGSTLGPFGSVIGGGIGSMAYTTPGKIATEESKINFNNQFIAGLGMGNDVHNNFSPNVQNGGYMNPEYNPQVITMFGDHNSDDFADYAHKYRAGGHLREYTPPSERAMQTYENGGNITSYAMGGQLKTYWGGHLETIVKNPYLEGSGEIAMIHGKDHKHGGVGISYGDTDNGQYQGHAANGAEMGAQVEAETREPIVQMANGGSVDPKTGKPSTEAVIFGNIPFSAKLAKATGDQDLIKIAESKDGKTYKKIIADFAAPQNKAAKTKIKAADLAANADQTKWGKLILTTAQAMEKGADKTQQQYASYIKKLAGLQNATQDVKKEQSFIRGENISAEELGKGKIENDYDPITKDAEIENPYANSDEVAKFGTSLRKAQNSTTITPTDDANYVSKYGITPWKGNTSKGNKYGKATASGFSTKQWDQIADKLGFKGHGNKEFEEFLLQNPESAPLIKARHQNLYGKDPFIDPEHFGYGWAANELLLPPPAEIPADTTPQNPEEASKKTNIVPYKRNKLVDIANMVTPWFRQNQLPPLDPRQLAGEYMALAQNQYEPVPSQQYTAELDPLYRVSYQDVRNQNTADFRDVEKQNAYNPAAMAGLLGKKYLANDSVNAEEFRTNQAIENQIYGGNRAKVNQERMANIQLNADQMNKQEMSKSRTKETQQAAIASIADKYNQHDARNLEYNVYKNMFPQFGFDSSGKIHNQGPWYQPNIPQIYGEQGTLKQVPVYGTDGKIDHYELQEYDPNGETKPSMAGPGIVAKNGKSISKKNNRNSSIVKAYKNL